MRPCELPPGVALRRADTRDDTAVATAVEDADTVVNAVSLYVERPARTADTTSRAQKGVAQKGIGVDWLGVNWP